MARKARKEEDNSTEKTEASEDTEESLVYDSILSACCCGSSSSDQNSIEDKKKQQQQDLERELQQRQGQRERLKNKHDDLSPKFWERLGDVALYLVGAAPPVKFVKCFECASVDRSDVTLPRALTDLAAKHDELNKRKLNCIWNTDENAAGATQATDRTSSDGHGAHKSHATSSQRSRRSKSRNSRRWNRFKIKGGCSDRSSAFSTALSSTFTEDSHLKNRVFKSGSSSGGSASRCNKPPRPESRASKRERGWTKSSGRSKSRKEKLRSGRYKQGIQFVEVDRQDGMMSNLCEL